MKSSKALKGILVAATLLLVSAGRTHAQSTQKMIDSAVTLYLKFDIEGARPLLQQVVSSNWLQPIADSQKVQAYKYLGASYAVIGRRDSASNFFQAALSYDAFTDLDPTAFGASELDAFELAKLKLYKVGVRPLAPQVIDPKSPNANQSTYRFRITTTQRSDILVSIASKTAARDSVLPEDIFRGQSDGTRDIVWRGNMGTRIAPPGTYEFRITGYPTAQGKAGEIYDKQDFVIEHSFEALEDTLPTLTAADLLVETIGGKDPLWDLIKGAALGLSAAAIPLVALDDSKIATTDKSTWNSHWAIASAVGVGAGLLAFRYRDTHRDIPKAKAENALRQQKRLEFNDGVRRRNADRLDKTKLILCPVGVVC